MSINSTLYSSIYLGWYLNNIGFRIKLLTSQKLKYNFQLETRILLPKWYLIFSNNWHLNNGTDLKPFSCAGCQLCCCAIQCNERCIVCLFTCFCHYTDFGASVYMFLRTRKRCQVCKIASLHISWFKTSIQRVTI